MNERPARLVPPTDPAALPGYLEACWGRAQNHWSSFLLLGAPIDAELEDSIAQISLNTRQVSVDLARMRREGLLNTLEAVLAHEVGHHVRFPGTLAIHARLRMLEKDLLPFEEYSLLNRFTDALINTHLGAIFKDDFCQIYRTLSAGERWTRDPAFGLYLAMYEELWNRPRGELMGAENLDGFESDYPGYRADAQMLAENLTPLGPNLYSQYLYFASIMSRYLKPQDEGPPKNVVVWNSQLGDPSDDDWANALMPTGREINAIRRAIEEGWLTPELGEKMISDDSLQRRIDTLPGRRSADASRIPEIMAAYYRREAERYLLKPPALPRLGEAVVPTSLEEWEIGDDVQSIDWAATLSARGVALGGISPLRRSRIAEVEGYDEPFWQPRVEIYLDVSGSNYNAMTLAAQILTLGSVRAGGWARALIYSGSHVAYWRWCRSEVEMSRFLMHYVGGGTIFPFQVLAESLEECSNDQPVRAIITDTDFDHNYDEKPEHAKIFHDAAAQSSPLVLLQHRPAWSRGRDKKDRTDRYRRVGAEVVIVDELEDFPRLAVGLARAFFETKTAR